LFKEAGPDKMKLLKGSILKGSPNMPGFQYGLEPKEVEDLIAYLKLCRSFRSSDEAHMLRIKALSLLVFVFLMIGICFLAQDSCAGNSCHGYFVGDVKSSEGKPLEAFGVSARNASRRSPPRCTRIRAGDISFRP